MTAPAPRHHPLRSCPRTLDACRKLLESPFPVNPASFVIHSASPRGAPGRRLLLRNHGLLTVGPTIADAFLSMLILQHACEIQVAAQSPAQG